MSVISASKQRGRRRGASQAPEVEVPLGGEGRGGTVGSMVVPCEHAGAAPMWRSRPARRSIAPVKGRAHCHAGEERERERAASAGMGPVLLGQ